MMMCVIILINVIIDVIVFYELYKKLSDVNGNVSSKYCQTEFILRKMDAMKCCKCGKKIEGPATYIRMENATNKNLNKVMAVCNDCGYGFIHKGVEIDPILLKEN